LKGLSKEELEMRKKVGRITSIMLCFVLVATIFSVAIQMNVKAEDYVLHPGYITGSINVPGETLVQGAVYASGYDPVNQQSYSAQTNVNPQTGEYTLVVEGGNWPYTVRAHIYLTGKYFYSNHRTTTVAEGETVIVNFHTDAVIQGTIEVQGETLNSAWIRISGQAGHTYGYYANIYPSGSEPYYTYSMPVFGGTESYRVECRDVVTTDFNDRLLFPMQYVTVGVDETAVVDFKAVPAYIEGTVSINIGTITGGRVYSSGLNGFSNTFFIDSNGKFSFPALASPNSRVYGEVYTTYGSYQLVKKYVDTFEGETTVVNWDITIETAQIIGDVAIVGTNYAFFDLRAHGPQASFKKFHSTGNGPYSLDDLRVGLWNLNAYIRSFESIPEPGIYDSEQYNFPNYGVTLQANEVHEKDYTLTASFIEGNVFSESSTAKDNFFSHQLWAKSQGQGSSMTYSQTTSFAMDYPNYYDMLVASGIWSIPQLNLKFNSDNYPSYPHTSTSMSIYDYNPPTFTVGSGETVEHNINYDSADVTARFRVATGDLLSYPYIEGYYRYNPDGVRDKNIFLRADSNQYNVEEGIVEFPAIPGTYQINAKATVLGSITTFGQFELTVEPGDIIIVDPDAPNVDITFPPGNYETEEECVTVTGTVTDESEIASFTINEVNIPVGVDGSFSYQMCGLVIGDNVIEVRASDVNGNEVIIDRTVIRTTPANTAPTAVLGGPYSGIEGTAVTFDASGSSDLDGDILQYRWDFDSDGTWDTDFSTESTVSHTWNDDHSGTLIVEVYDGALSSTATADVTVINAPPEISSFPETSSDEGTSLLYSFSFSDPGILDTHTAVIDWGDGNVESVTVTESGGSGTFSASHSYSDNGDYSGTVTVTDNNGDSHSVALSVHIDNQPPEVSVTADVQTVDEGSPLELSGSYYDPGTADTHTFQWDFGDGTTASDLLDQTHIFNDEGTYVVKLTVTDDDSASGVVEVPITVNNVAPTAVLGNNVPQPEGSDVTVTFTDIFDPGTSDTFTYSFDWDNDGTYEIVDQADPSAVHSWPDDGLYTVGGKIKDNDGGYTEYTTDVMFYNVDPTADFSDNGPTIEGDPLTFSFTNIQDPGIFDTFTYSFDWDNDGIFEIYNQVEPSASHTWYNEGSYLVRAMIMDNSGGFNEYYVYTTVINEPPTIDSFIVTPTDPIAITDPVRVTASYLDPGDDTLTTTIHWGDGETTTTTGYSVDENHVYSTPGVYTITLIVSDGTDSVETSYQYVVVYDPTGSFITGGGQFDSPEGAYTADPTITGKAGFGFVSKYQKGKTIPGGNTEFRFHAADIQFKSTDYEWLVIAGSKGMFKGTGTINSEGSYKFIISAIDGDIQGGDGIDKFRIRIWEEDELGNEFVFYDNNIGAGIDADPTTALTHGSIKIHK
jgi:PKD repeat protein